MSTGAAEGKAFFPPDAIKTSGHWAFDPNDDGQFYSHFLLQVVYNKMLFTAQEKRGLQFVWGDHPRAEKLIIDGGYNNDDGVRYKYMTVMYGDANGNMIRTKSYHSSDDWNLNFAKEAVAFIPIPLPNRKKGETHLYIDMTLPIKKIFFPLVSPNVKKSKNARSCCYGHIDFTRVYTDFPIRNTDMSVHFPMDIVNGLDYHPFWTLRFDVQPLMRWLAIPPDDRNDEYTSNNFISCVNCYEIEKFRQKNWDEYGNDTIYDIQFLLQPPYIVDINEVIKKSQGIDVMYSPSGMKYEPMAEALKGMASKALGYVPGIGSLLALSVDTAYEAISDWDAFSKKFPDINKLAETINGTDVNDEDLKKNLQSLKKYLRKGLQKVGN